MKPTAMTLMCLLLATVWIQDVDSKSMVMPSNSCCLNTLKKELPLKFIQCYRKTGSTCPHPPAVIFRLKKDIESCASTNNTWVQNHLKKVNLC
ncbi:C-C motif chemokine 1 isoform X1 [Mus caroli]|uniref:C-C motif chemokine n=1 Tax=Mus caroli TaxID=10089 RepID=A0A6P5QKF7_MUSCR|nr:C-C motif chemokine 1 isoform X1 [Mus caroli]